MAAKRTRAEIEAELAELDAEEADAEPEYEYEIGRGDNYARVSSKSKAGRKLETFFKESFGIDLADEPVQEEPAEGEGEGEPKRKAQGRQQQGGQNVRAFRGRGVG